MHIRNEGDVNHVLHLLISLFLSLSAELTQPLRPVAIAPESVPVADALAKVKDVLATALAQVGEALRLVELPGEAGEVETR
jgi:hypothetical protein